jgi:SAM-dependent methyltransferase
MTGLEAKEAVRPGPSCQIWRYLVPASALKEVLVLGDSLGPDALDAVREAAHVITFAPDFGGTDPFPFKDGGFDLVILADYGRDRGRVGDLEATLRECRRVLTPDGYLYMTAVNRFRARSAGLTLPGFRKNIKRAGFGPARWWACFPDAREPRCLVDLDGAGVMDYFVSSYLNLDLRTGPLVRRVGRLVCRLGIAPYLVKGYAVLGRSRAVSEPREKA